MFTPFQLFADWLIFGVFSITPLSHLGMALNFFVFDILKIITLLIIIISVVGLINSYIPFEKIREILTKRKWYGLDYFLATILGLVTPFCTCSSIPMFIGLLRAGIPLGVVFAFLISSPLISEIAIAMFGATFGWQVTLIYIISGIVVGMVCGWIISLLKLDKYVDQTFLNTSKKEINDLEEKISFKKRLSFVWEDSWSIIKKVIPYVIIGIAIGAAIHGFIPTDFFESYLTKENPFGVIIAVIIAVPIYANPAGAVPVLESLVTKGVPLGTALAFMMAIIALSLPEFLMLKKVMKTKLLLIFFGLVTIAIILLGYLYNIIF